MLEPWLGVSGTRRNMWPFYRPGVPVRGLGWTRARMRGVHLGVCAYVVRMRHAHKACAGGLRRRLAQRSCAEVMRRGHAQTACADRMRRPHAQRVLAVPQMRGTTPGALTRRNWSRGGSAAEDKGPLGWRPERKSTAESPPDRQ